MRTAIIFKYIKHKFYFTFHLASCIIWRISLAARTRGFQSLERGFDSPIRHQKKYVNHLKKTQTAIIFLNYLCQK